MINFFAGQPSCEVLGGNLFDCKDGSCLSPEAECDGREDCLSGQDEQDCSKYLLPTVWIINLLKYECLGDSWGFIGSICYYSCQNLEMGF